MVQSWCDIEVVLDVPPEAFKPMPKVLSSVFVARPHTRCDIKHPELFEQVVAIAFRHRRKFCHSAFKKHIELDAWLEMGLAQNSRPGDLTVQNYIDMANYLYNKFGEKAFT